MITIISYTKDKLPLQKKEIQYLIETVTKSEKVAVREVALVIVGTTRMRTLNKRYRKKDAPTDILSFQADDDEAWGDLILCPAYIEKKAREYNQSKKEAYTVLCIHGLFHLLGYDHSTESDFKRMLQKEVDVYRKVAKTLGIPSQRSDI